MLDRQAIDKEIDQILQTSLFPLSIDELLSKVSCRVKFPEIDITQLYSPHRQYTAKERLFHPAQQYLSWFTVAEPITNKSFQAIFDNGARRKLAHNSSDTFTFVPDTITHLFQKFLKVILQEREDTDEVEGLYINHSIYAQIPFRQLSNPHALVTLAKWRATSREPDSKNLLRELCIKHQLYCLFYLAPLGNLSSILDRGILARNLAPKERQSFANEEIQAKRSHRCPDPRLQLTLHDYVPLFFAPKPPLLYALREKQQSLVYFLVNPVILLEPGVAFSAANAVSSEKFYTDVADLDCLNWPILQAEYWNRNKLQRQAEAQIPVTVPLGKILKIVVYDKSALDHVQREIDARNLPIKAEVDEGLFY